MNPVQILETHFSHELKRYPNVLTFHPDVDCDYGRYLMASTLNDVGGDIGKSLILQTSILNFAIAFNLTIINDDNSLNDYFGNHHFHVSRTEYDACLSYSNVKANQFEAGEHFNMINDDSIINHNDTNEFIVTPTPIKPILWSWLTTYMRMFPYGGFTIVKTNGFLERGGLSRAGLIMEIRYHVLRDSQQMAKPMKNSIVMSVHVQRNNDAVFQIIHQVWTLLSTTNQKRLVINIYSNGFYADFVPLIESLKEMGVLQVGCVLNMSSSTTFFDLMIQSDILIVMDSSSLSYAAGIFNSNSLKIGPQYFDGNFQGLRNFIGINCLTVDRHCGYYYSFQNSTHLQLMLNETIIELDKEQGQHKFSFVIKWKQPYPRNRVKL